MNVITSLTNQKVKDWVSLGKKQNRYQEGLFLVESEHLVSEAISLNLVKEVITTLDTEYDVTTYKVTGDIMKKISNLESYPSIMGVVRMPLKRDISGNVLLLERIQDPGNLGTIIRSAVAFGIDTIITSKDTVDIYNDKTIRASEGMIFKLNIYQDDLFKVVDELKSDGYKIYSTNVVGGVDLESVCVNTKFGVIFGNEGAGVSEELGLLSDEYLKIRMNSNCESLNVGVAASIVMYSLGGK